MKILHTSDWHIGQFKGPVVNGMNLRSQDTVKCLEYMVDVASKEKPDIVCISGDIFHQEQVGPVRYSDEMITATNIITSLAHFSKYVIVMRGTPNHDGAAQFRVLERMLLNIKNVDVVTEPRVLKTPYQKQLISRGRSDARWNSYGYMRSRKRTFQYMKNEDSMYRNVFQKWRRNCRCSKTESLSLMRILLAWKPS